MDQRFVTLIAAVVALAVGFGIGAVVYSNDEAAPLPEVQDDDSEATATPADTEGQESCLAALDAAEQEVQAEQRTSDLLDEYENVIGRASDALADFDTRQLEDLLTQVEDLNRRSERLIDQTRNADLSSAIDTCREALGTNEI